MNTAQHGFTYRILTISQKLSFYKNIIISKLENGDDINVIYLDVSKAFEKVYHNILTHKINALNITGKILKWLETFFKKRQQNVKVNGYLSDWIWVLLVVPRDLFLVHYCC